MKVTLPLSDYLVIAACICFSYLYLLYRAIKESKNKGLILIEGIKIFALLIAVLATVYILLFS